MFSVQAYKTSQYVVSRGGIFLVQYTMFTVQTYETSQYVVPRGDILFGKWRSSFTGNSVGKMNVQLACALNTRYKLDLVSVQRVRWDRHSTESAGE
jgi:hypothetical protein